MDRFQSLNAPTYFDGSNYVFWKVRMPAFLCAIDETMWDFVENGYVKPTTAKSKWDKAILALVNANSKAINAIFCGVSIDEFHRISHVKAAKEVWTIFETTYEGIKKVKDTKLQMHTTWFEEVKMSDDESFDSFYGRLNEIVIAKLNLGEKIENTKVVRKILRSLPKNFRAMVTAIEENKDLDEIKIQELIGSLQTYELRLPFHKSSKSLTLKTINEKMGDSFDEDDVEKEVAFLAKKFQKFLKMKNNGKSFGKEKYSSSKNDKREFKNKDGKDSSLTQGIVCYECNNHGHLKKECPNYLIGKGKVLATTLSDLESSNFDVEGECDSEGNYLAFMEITTVDFRDDLSDLVDELGVHFEGEKVDDLEDKDVYLNEGEKNLQEVYDVLLEDCDKYAKVAKNAIKKMKKV